MDKLKQSTDGTAGKPQGGQNIAGERAPEPTAESRCADTDTVRPPAPSTPPAPDGDAVIKEAVRRFLAWPLPKDFSPDCGITFTPDYNQHTPWPAKHEPVGTNLFTADQARAMFEHCLAAPPSQAQGETDWKGRAETAERALHKLGWRTTTADVDGEPIPVIEPTESSLAAAERRAEEAEKKLHDLYMAAERVYGIASSDYRGVAANAALMAYQREADQYRTFLAQRKETT